ncbi:MAG: Tol-Pal system protein TolB, partial [Alphaproteobacteria bacterium]
MSPTARHLARLATLCLALLAAALPARAQLFVDVTRGNVEPLPIAVPAFVALGASETAAGPLAAVGENIAAVAAADLDRSGLFRPIDRRAFIAGPTSADVRPRFGDWRAIAAQA